MSTDQTSRQEQLAQSVIHGGSGQLFHRDHEAIEQLSGVLSFTPAEIEAWRNSIETRKAWCNANGIAFRMVIIPEKHTALQDCLPPEIVISENRPARQLMAALPEEVARDCFYPIELLSAVNERPTYFQTDTHFTMYGAFLVYSMLMDSLSDLPHLAPLQRDDVDFKPQTFTGDLAVRLEPKPEELVDFLVHTKNFPFERIFDNKRYTRGHTVVFESDRKDAPRCLMIRDSFANYLIPHMIPVFSRVVAIGSISMHYDLIRAERPDVVIFEIAERFLGYLDGNGQRILPDDLGVVSFEEYSGVALEALP